MVEHIGSPAKYIFLVLSSLSLSLSLSLYTRDSSPPLPLYFQLFYVYQQSHDKQLP